METETILYETKEFLVVKKPVGLASQGDGSTDDLCSRLAARCGRVCYAVHRLDQMTGGVMVYAKTKATAAALGQAFAAHAVQKEYLCVTEGCPKPAQGQLCDVLFSTVRRARASPCGKRQTAPIGAGQSPQSFFMRFCNRRIHPWARGRCCAFALKRGARIRCAAKWRRRAHRFAATENTEGATTAAERHFGRLRCVLQTRKQARSFRFAHRRRRATRGIYLTASKRSVEASLKR